MTTFFDLTEAARALILISLFTGSLCSVALVFQGSNTAKRWKSRLLWCVLFAAQSTTLAILTEAENGHSCPRLLCEMPIFVMALLGLSSIARVIYIVIAKDHGKKELTPEALRQFIDDMPTALSF